MPHEGGVNLDTEGNLLSLSHSPTKDRSSSLKMEGEEFRKKLQICNVAIIKPIYSKRIFQEVSWRRDLESICRGVFRINSPKNVKFLTLILSRHQIIIDLINIKMCRILHDTKQWIRLLCCKYFESGNICWDRGRRNRRTFEWNRMWEGAV